MKKYIFPFILMVAAFTPYPTKAQISVNFNVASQPLWGPVGYEKVDYYYLPDIETYYYVPQRQFVYLNNGQWVFSSALPPSYSSYNLYNGYKVVINAPKPYLLFKEDKIKYVKYKNIHTQPIIIKSEDPKYFVIKGHPKNPHGIAPGQAKKAISESNGQAKGNGNEKGIGTGQVKKMTSESNGQAKGNGNGNEKGNGNGNGNGKGKGK